MANETYLYFIKPVGMDGPIKIGYSRIPRGRLLALSAWSPFALEIVGVASGGSKEETFLHRRFANLHTHREWFNSSPLLRHTMMRIIAGDGVREACEEIPVKGDIRNQRRRIATPARQRFIDYGKKIRNVLAGLRNDRGSSYAPPDVTKIMDDWRGDYLHKKPVEPTEADIQRLDEFLVDPARHAIFIEYGVMRERCRDHKAMVAEAFERQMSGAVQ